MIAQVFILTRDGSLLFYRNYTQTLPDAAIDRFWAFYQQWPPSTLADPFFHVRCLHSVGVHTTTDTSRRTLMAFGMLGRKATR